ncbi:MAG: hypothetical protein KatS3mg124_0214 [Porticoccaceae bacterium]|nr:MAG: hypothetical protein KatS3mg124_0214 [Porticoccaceae bacterium]
MLNSTTGTAAGSRPASASRSRNSATRSATVAPWAVRAVSTGAQMSARRAAISVPVRPASPRAMGTRPAAGLGNTQEGEKRSKVPSKSGDLPPPGGVGEGAAIGAVFLVAPGGPQGGDALRQGGVTAAEGNAGIVVGELFGVPARAQAQHEAPLREDVQRRRRAGQVQQLVLEGKRHPGAEAQPTTRSGRQRRRHEGVHHVRVAVGNGAAGIGKLVEAVHRQMAVLGEPEGIKAPGLELAGELVGADAAGGVEREVAEAHENPPVTRPDHNRPGRREEVAFLSEHRRCRPPRHRRCAAGGWRRRTTARPRRSRACSRPRR